MTAFTFRVFLTVIAVASLGAAACQPKTVEPPVQKQTDDSNLVIYDDTTQQNDHTALDDNNDQLTTGDGLQNDQQNSDSNQQDTVGQDSNDTVGDDSAPAPLTGYIDALCGYLFRCTTKIAVMFATEADCNSALGAMPPDDVFFVRNATKKAACATEYDSVTDCIYDPFIGIIPHSCREMAVGTAVAGANCFDDPDICAPANFCYEYVDDSDTEYCPTCKARVTANQTCDAYDENCPLDLQCDGSACIPYQLDSPVGADCEFSSDCATRICYNSRCKQYPVENQDCLTDATSGNDGLCAYPLVCNDQKKCIRPTLPIADAGHCNVLTDDDNLTLTVNPCLANSSCVWIEALKSHRCFMRRGLGADCVDSAQCQNGLYCNIQLAPDQCGPYAPLNESCAHALCAPGLFCSTTDSVCLALLPTGSTCGDDYECASTLCDWWDTEKCITCVLPPL